MKLIIVESPTKAKTISKFLGKGFNVESSFGHVRDLPKSTLGVDVENNFEPKYIVPLKAKKNLNVLKKLASKAEEIILATDEDREGEAIAWHLAEALNSETKKPKPKKDGSLPPAPQPMSFTRIAFHEITKKAIEEALQSPREIDMNMVNAQQARRILDRLVGYKLSPFLWKKVARGLSAGRVQSVAVRLIAEREAEIEAFKKEEYWTIEGDFKKESDIFKGELNKIDGKALEKFDVKTSADAQKIVDDAGTGQAVIKTVETKEEKKHAPAPFTTSTLQQTASQRLGFSAKQTMMFAQHLYEKGFITYMRTDSLNISKDALAQAADFAEKSFGKEYLLATPRVFKTKSKGAQEAHEAIRPTDVWKTSDELKKSLEEPKEWKLYDLIWRRFLASQFPEARVESTKIDIDVSAKDHNYIFRASGARLTFEGFLKIYPMKFSENILPKLLADEKIEIAQINPLQHFTEPPPRYNEASLIKTLEKFGIGRPSTYAPIISTIQDRGYVEKNEDRRLRPTETGKIVNTILVENFPQIVDIDFTAKMEEELDEVAEGKIKWEPVIKEFYDPFAKNLEEKYESVVTQKVEEKTDEVCPKCGKPMVIKRGRFGKFIACSGFPECKTTKKLPDPTLNMKCPKCAVGDVVRRRTKKGRFFFGCSRYPDCDFASWTNPTLAVKQPENDATVKE